MVGHFFSAHRTLAYLVGASFFVLSGCGLARLDRKNPILALGSWFMALLYLTFSLATMSGGAVVALAVFVGGVVWMVRYYQKHRPE
jgi:hypothetical protein